MFCKNIIDFFLSKKIFNLIILDQIIVSGSNFLISILILRFLGIEDFGIFSFCWLFLILINGTQISFIISPMFTNAPKQNTSTIDLFYGGVFFQQLIFTLIIYLLFFFLLKFFGNYNLDYEFQRYYFQFSLTIVVTQLYQFIRRLLFSKKLYLKAIISDFTCYLSLIILLFYFDFLNLLTLEKVWWIFFYCFLLVLIINFKVILTLKFNFLNIYYTVKENWIIGKWLLLTSVTQWFSGNLWLVNAGIILGPFNFGIIRACQSLLNISNIFFQSIENFIPAATSEKFKIGGIKAMDVYLKNFTIKYFKIIFLVVIIIILFSKNLLNFFYGNETSNYYQILVYLSILLPIHFLQYPLNYKFRTIGNTKPIFITFLFTAIIALIFSSVIIKYFTMQGLIFGLYINQIIIIYLLNSSYNRLKKIYY